MSNVTDDATAQERIHEQKNFFLNGSINNYKGRYSMYYFYFISMLSVVAHSFHMEGTFRYRSGFLMSAARPWTVTFEMQISKLYMVCCAFYANPRGFLIMPFTIRIESNSNKWCAVFEAEPSVWSADGSASGCPRSLSLYSVCLSDINLSLSLSPSPSQLNLFTFAWNYRLLLELDLPHSSRDREWNRPFENLWLNFT
jgi:hypothetical protein